MAYILPCDIKTEYIDVDVPEVETDFIEEDDTKDYENLSGVNSEIKYEYIEPFPSHTVSESVSDKTSYVEDENSKIKNEYIEPFSSHTESVFEDDTKKYENLSARQLLLKMGRPKKYANEEERRAARTAQMQQYRANQSTEKREHEREKRRDRMRRYRESLNKDMRDQQRENARFRMRKSAVTKRARLAGALVEIANENEEAIESRACGEMNVLCECCNSEFTQCRQKVSESVSDKTSYVEDENLSGVNSKIKNEYMEPFLTYTVPEVETNFIEEDDTKNYDNLSDVNSEIKYEYIEPEIFIKEENDEEMWSKNEGIHDTININYNEYNSRVMSLYNEDTQPDDSYLISKHNDTIKLKRREQIYQYSSFVNISEQNFSTTGIKCKKLNNNRKTQFSFEERSQSLVQNTDVKHFFCKECSKSFIDNKQFKAHFISMHSNVENFSCDICNKSFSVKASLYRHILIHFNVKFNDHFNVKHFSCTLCSKSFTQEYRLMNHMFIHTGVKEFSCPECGRTFAQKHHLETHMLIHTGVKQFSCPECGKSYTKNSKLKTHMLIHTGVKQLS